MIGRSQLLLGAVGVLALGVLVAPVQAGTSSATKPVGLAGTTVVRASATSHQLVHVREDAVLRLDSFGGTSFPGYELTGNGQLRGLVLLSTTRRQGGTPGRMLWLLGGGFCMKRGCTPLNGGKVWPWSIGFPEIRRNTPTGYDWRVTIPQGTYRLYAITDGAPITATLRLQGLTGRTSFTPSARLPFANPITPRLSRSASTPLGERELWEVTHLDGWGRGPFLYLGTSYTHRADVKAWFCADKPEQVDGGVEADCPVSRDPRAVIDDPNDDSLMTAGYSDSGGDSFTAGLGITPAAPSFRAQIKAYVERGRDEGFTVAYLFVPVF